MVEIPAGTTNVQDLDLEAVYEEAKTARKNEELETLNSNLATSPSGAISTSSPINSTFVSSIPRRATPRMSRTNQGSPDATPDRAPSTLSRSSSATSSLCFSSKHQPEGRPDSPRDHCDPKSPLGRAHKRHVSQPMLRGSEEQHSPAKPQHSSSSPFVSGVEPVQAGRTPERRVSQPLAADSRAIAEPTPTSALRQEGRDVLYCGPPGRAPVILRLAFSFKTVSTLGRKALDLGEFSSSNTGALVNIDFGEISNASFALDPLVCSVIDADRLSFEDGKILIELSGAPTALRLIETGITSELVEHLEVQARSSSDLSCTMPDTEMGVLDDGIVETASSELGPVSLGLTSMSIQQADFATCNILTDEINPRMIDESITPKLVNMSADVASMVSSSSDIRKPGVSLSITLTGQYTSTSAHVSLVKNEPAPSESVANPSGCRDDSLDRGKVTLAATEEPLSIDRQACNGTPEHEHYGVENFSVLSRSPADSDPITLAESPRCSDAGHADFIVPEIAEIAETLAILDKSENIKIPMDHQSRHRDVRQPDTEVTLCQNEAARNSSPGDSISLRSESESPDDFSMSITTLAALSKIEDNNDETVPATSSISDLPKGAHQHLTDASGCNNRSASTPPHSYLTSEAKRSHSIMEDPFTVLGDSAQHRSSVTHFGLHNVVSSAVPEYDSTAKIDFTPGAMGSGQPPIITCFFVMTFTKELSRHLCSRLTIDISGPKDTSIMMTRVDEGCIHWTYLKRPHEDDQSGYNQQTIQIVHSGFSLGQAICLVLNCVLHDFSGQRKVFLPTVSLNGKRPTNEDLLIARVRYPLHIKLDLDDLLDWNHIQNHKNEDEHWQFCRTNCQVMVSPPLQITVATLPSMSFSLQKSCNQPDDYPRISQALAKFQPSTVNGVSVTLLTMELVIDRRHQQRLCTEPLLRVEIPVAYSVSMVQIDDKVATCYIGTRGEIVIMDSEASRNLKLIKIALEVLIPEEKYDTKKASLRSIDLPVFPDLAIRRCTLVLDSHAAYLANVQILTNREDQAPDTYTIQGEHKAIITGLHKGATIRSGIWNDPHGVLNASKTCAEADESASQHNRGAVERYTEVHTWCRPRFRAFLILYLLSIVTIAHYLVELREHIYDASNINWSSVHSDGVTELLVSMNKTQQTTRFLLDNWSRLSPVTFQSIDQDACREIVTQAFDAPEEVESVSRVLSDVEVTLHNRDQYQSLMESSQSLDSALQQSETVAPSSLGRRFEIDAGEKARFRQAFSGLFF